MQIKRTLTYFEEIALEAGQPIDPPLRTVAAAAIIDNPSPDASSATSAG